MSASDDLVQSGEITISDLDTLKLVFDPLRMKILEAFSGEPRTVKDIAEELGSTPQRLYYHVNMLEERGLLRVVSTRMVTSMIEKTYKTAAYRINIDDSLLTFGEQSEAIQILLARGFEDTKQAVIDGARAGVIDLSKRAPHLDALLMRRGSVRLTEAQAAEFYARFLALEDEFVALEHREDLDDTKRYTYFFSFFPSILKANQSD